MQPYSYSQCDILVLAGYCANWNMIDTCYLIMFGCVNSKSFSLTAWMSLNWFMKLWFKFQPNAQLWSTLAAPMLRLKPTCWRRSTRSGLTPPFSTCLTKNRFLDETNSNSQSNVLVNSTLSAGFLVVVNFWFGFLTRDWRAFCTGVARVLAAPQGDRDSPRGGNLQGPARGGVLQVQLGPVPLPGTEGT